MTEGAGTSPPPRTFVESTAAPPPEAELLARCRTGDEAAWRELVGRFSRYVYAIAVRGFRLGVEDAEDVFQEVFTRLYEQLDVLRDDAGIRRWIAQVTRRLCVDHFRERNPEAIPLEEADPGGLDERLTRIDETLTIWRAVEKLSDQCREILDRFFCRDESYATISRALAVAPGTVASRISRCLDRLRERLQHQWEAPVRVDVDPR